MMRTAHRLPGLSAAAQRTGKRVSTLHQGGAHFLARLRFYRRPHPSNETPTDTPQRPCRQVPRSFLAHPRPQGYIGSTVIGTPIPSRGDPPYLRVVPRSGIRKYRGERDMTTRDQRIIQRIRELFATPQDNVPLHAPLFTGNERRYVLDAIESTFVSSVGAYVGRLEKMIAEFVGARFAVATVNGTSALHIALHLMGVRGGDLVITQPTTFVATGNAIAYGGAGPLLLDVDMASIGRSPEALEEYLNRYCRQSDGRCVHEPTGRPVSACVPVHVFGHPCRIDAIASRSVANGVWRWLRTQ